MSLGHPYKFQRVLRLGIVTARHLVVGVSQTAASNRGRHGRHLCLAGRPSGWALAHISSFSFSLTCVPSNIFSSVLGIFIPISMPVIWCENFPFQLTEVSLVFPSLLHTNCVFVCLSVNGSEGVQNKRPSDQRTNWGTCDVTRPRWQAAVQMQTL